MVDVIKNFSISCLPFKAVVHVFQYFLYVSLTSVRAAIAVLINSGSPSRLRDGLLDKSITVRIPELPCPTTFFRYLYSLRTGLGLYFAPDLFFDFIAVFLQVVLEFGIFLTIHSFTLVSRPAVMPGSDFLR